MPAPTLETPPNPVEPSSPVKVRTGRFGELEEHELIHLLDTLDDERARSSFRESIYISLFVYMILLWFVFYGPRVLFHQPRIIMPSVLPKERGMTSLALPQDLARQMQRAPKTLAAPAPRAAVEPKALAAPPTPRSPAVKPLPATPQPQPTAPVRQAQPTPLPPLQRPARPAPPVLATIPDAPKPSPSFGGQDKSAGDTIRDALEGAAKNRRGGGEYGNAITPSHVGVGTGVDVLSDMQGVNFDPYLRKIMREIYDTWIPLIPEEARPPLNKQGITQLRITIMPDGRLHMQDGANDGMVLEGSTHDDALNRAAWGSITGVGQFPPLPSEFHGPNLVLRIHYLVNQKQE